MRQKNKLIVLIVILSLAVAGIFGILLHAHNVRLQKYEKEGVRIKDDPEDVENATSEDSQDQKKTKTDQSKGTNPKISESADDPEKYESSTNKDSYDNTDSSANNGSSNGKNKDDNKSSSGDGASENNNTGPGEGESELPAIND